MPWAPAAMLGPLGVDVVMTADGEAALAAGMDSVVTKPIVAKDLFAANEGALPMHLAA